MSFCLSGDELGGLTSGGEMGCSQSKGELSVSCMSKEQPCLQSQHAAVPAQGVSHAPIVPALAGGKVCEQTVTLPCEMGTLFVPLGTGGKGTKAGIMWVWRPVTEGRAGTGDLVLPRSHPQAPRDIKITWLLKLLCLSTGQIPECSLLFTLKKQMACSVFAGITGFVF